MNNWYSRKAVIPEYQIPFLTEIAREAGIISLSDAVNQAIIEAKKYRLLLAKKFATQDDLSGDSPLEIMPVSQGSSDDVLGTLNLD